MTKIKVPTRIQPVKRMTKPPKPAGIPALNMFTCTRSVMEPPFWVVRHGTLAIAEVHTELYAKKIVAALNRDEC